MIRRRLKMSYCAECDTHRRDLIKTAYGDYLCEDCWDDYINSDAGRLEYLIAICNEESFVDEFDADFLIGVAKSWMLNFSALDLTPQERYDLEQKARKLGIL
jgi:hypothetical protein